MVQRRYLGFGGKGPSSELPLLRAAAECCERGAELASEVPLIAMRNSGTGSADTAGRSRHTKRGKRGGNLGMRTTSYSRQTWSAYTVWNEQAREALFISLYKPDPLHPLYDAELVASAKRGDVEPFFDPKYR